MDLGDHILRQLKCDPPRPAVPASGFNAGANEGVYVQLGQQIPKRPGGKPSQVAPLAKSYVIFLGRP